MAAAAAAARFLERSGNYAAPRMTMTPRYSALTSRSCASCAYLREGWVVRGWLRSGAAGEDIKGRGRGGVQLRHVSATYILVRLILPGGIIARGRRERFHYTASRGIIFSDISLAAPAGLKFRPFTVSASPSAPLLPGDPPRPTPSRNDGGNCRRVHARGGFRSRKMADS